MADDHYSSKRKYDDPSPPPRRTGFSSGPPPASPPPGGAPLSSSYNTVPPPPDEIQLAKQRAQEIAARLFSAAEAKRPRVDNGDDDVGSGGGSLGGSGRIGGGGLGFSSSAGGGKSLGCLVKPTARSGDLVVCACDSRVLLRCSSPCINHASIWLLDRKIYQLELLWSSFFFTLTRFRRF